ncbi:MAG: hypothetical protein QXJ51_01905 [Sulfolobales archaeon]
MVYATKIPDENHVRIFRDHMMKLGVERIILTRMKWCYSGYIEYKGFVLEALLGLGGNGYYYLKICWKPSDLMDCDHILYNPYGFFVFSKDLRELAEKTLKKLGKLVEKNPSI